MPNKSKAEAQVGLLLALCKDEVKGNLEPIARIMIYLYEEVYKQAALIDKIAGRELALLAEVDRLKRQVEAAQAARTNTDRGAENGSGAHGRQIAYGEEE